MADEFEGQVEEQASPDVTPAETPATETSAQAIDYTALENEAAQLAPGMTLPNVVKSYHEAVGKMNTTVQEKTDMQKKYESAMLLQDQINSDPDLGNYLTEQIKGYYDGEGQTAPKQVTQAVSPDALRVNQLENTVQNIIFNTKINELRNTHGNEVLDHNVEREINERIAQTGVNDPEMHFWAIKGKQLLSQKMKEASTQTAEQIAQNTSAYNVNQGGPAPPAKQVNVADLSQKEWSDALDDELDKMVGEGPMI